MRTLILGLGNELLGDEGVGVHGVRLLQHLALPEDTVVLEIGTAILDALCELEQAERVIVLDAMRENSRAGTIYKIPLDHCSGSPCIASMHGFDIFRVMALTGRAEPPPVMVFGVEPEMIGWSMALSPSIAESLPYLVEAVLRELQTPQL